MNNRWRQKNKAFFRYILYTTPQESREIPYDVMNVAKVCMNQIASAIDAENIRIFPMMMS